MHRPTIMVAEPEPSQALSVRKLVLETAKFNVLTAHSTEEATELFGLFPNIDAAVLVKGAASLDCEHVAAHIKSVTDKVPTIGIRCGGTDHTVQSYDPEQLLNILRGLLGDPRVSHQLADDCD